MKAGFKKQRGAVLIIFAILLIVLIGFVALAMDVGRWYTVRAELSKAVDAAALAGAKNISNPYLGDEGHLRLAERIGRQNFTPGYMMTPESGDGTVTFTARALEEHRIEVTGNVRSPGNLASLFGVDFIATGAMGVARKNEVEIMLVLDRSGSMSGSKMTNLKDAARSFVSFFEETQDQDKMGLISFATSVILDVPLGNNYVTLMNSRINAMSAVGATNASDALAQVLRTGGLTDQSGVPGDRRVQQFVIFFSDGMPTALRGTFRTRNQVYDAVACTTGNCRQGENVSIYGDLGRPAQETWHGINPTPTGDGTYIYTSQRGWHWTTKWDLFESRPVPGYTATHYNIPASGRVNYTATHNFVTHLCNLARERTQANAQLIKDRHVKIYTIGLGSSNDIDADFLLGLSSGPGYAYTTPTSTELKAIFNAIAKDIKLRLVQ